MKIGFYRGLKNLDGDILPKIIFDTEDCHRIGISKQNMPVAEFTGKTVRIQLRACDTRETLETNVGFRRAKGMTSANHSGRALVRALGLKDPRKAVTVPYEVASELGKAYISLVDIEKAVKNAPRLQERKLQKREKIGNEGIGSEFQYQLEDRAPSSSPKRVRMTNDMIALIGAALGQFYIPKLGQYQKGHSDNSIARNLGIRTDQVASIRKGMFAKDDAGIKEIRKKLDEVIALMDKYF